MWAIRHVLPPPSAVESSIYQSLLKALSIRTGPTLKTHKPVDLDPIMRRIVGINTTTGRWADRAMNILHKVTFLLGFYGFLRPSDVHRAIRANSVINGRRYSGTRFTGNPTTPDLIVSVYGPKERRAGHRIIKEIIIKRADRRFSSLCPFCRGINLRAEGSTAAYNNGSSIGDIVAHANWSSSSMFLEYYKRVRTTQFDMTAGLNAGLNAEFSIESFEEEELLDGSQPQVEGEDDPPLEEATTIDPA
ncbi:hypothetical protein GQ42DRAFT_150530 [Ramicandelaber brevisporus]|nr:hypothetical protein GQ42DRAFT_150530 [Ramicandelaber brevisporus]